MMTLKELKKSFADDYKMILVILYNEYLLSASKEIAKEIKVAYEESKNAKDIILGAYETEIKRIIA